MQLIIYMDPVLIASAVVLFIVLFYCSNMPSRCAEGMLPSELSYISARDAPLRVASDARFS